MKNNYSCSEIIRNLLILMTLTIVLLGCADTHIEEENVNPPFYVSIETDARVSDLKNNLDAQKRVLNSRTAQEVLDLADWTRVNILEKPSDNKVIYTIPMLNSVPTKKLQLVIVELIGDLNPFVIQYEPSEDWLNDLDFRAENPIDGRIEFQTLEGEVTNETLDKSAKGITQGKAGCDCELVAFRSAYATIGAGPPGVSEPDVKYEIVWVEVCSCTSGPGLTGTGGLEGGEEGSKGSGSKGEDPDFVIISEGDCVGGYEKVNDICVPPCGSDEVRVGWNCINEAELWEDEIDDSELDPCMKQVFDDLMGLSQGVGKILSELDDGSPSFTWKLDHKYLTKREPARTEVYDDGTVTTFFDLGQISKSSQLGTALVVLHEGVHAYLQKDFINGSINSSYTSYSETLDELLFVDEDTEHKNMVQDYMTGIASSLKDYGRYNLNLTLSDQFYKDLAWGGLAYYIEKKKEVDYPWFIELVPNENDRDRIRDVVEVELNGKDQDGDKQTQKGGINDC